MKTNTRDIVISIAAFLLLAFAVLAFFKIVNTRQSSLKIDIHTLIPPNAEAILSINRPDIFRRMELDEPQVYRIYASEIPDVYLSILRKLNTESAAISFHQQGVLCYIQTEEEDSIVSYLREMFKQYTPQKQTVNGIDFYYLPDTENRFFGYYIYNNVWVGSYSRKLLMRAAEQQLKGEIVINEEAYSLLKEIDKNSPSNIVFHAAKTGIDFLEYWDDISWFSVDLFVNEGSFCCHARLPYMDENVNSMLSSFLETKYPDMNFSVQISNDGGEDTYFTACSSLRNSD